MIVLMFAGTQVSADCLPQWSNNCADDKQCSSILNTQWPKVKEFFNYQKMKLNFMAIIGVIIMMFAAESQSCLPNGSYRCTSNRQCCSGFCKRNVSGFGLCRKR
ncbi:hypothetical protein HCN44_009746 [Aphidius gifuensis]|uniref:UPF0506 domain-containing protein n=1 Tax=Aphidius gifuensis TaxID=684658 RepID=A0A834Y736_APHGI|nr:hypothetical protein HCN44_009746 [Aphidius gifuensis]